MTNQVLLDDVFIDARSPAVALTSPGFAYAACAFEGICVYVDEHGELSLFRLDDHLRRLEASMRALGVDAPPTRATLRERVIRAVGKSSIAPESGRRDGHVRLMAFLDGETRIGSRGPVRTAIAVREAGARPSTGPALHCRVASWRKPPDTALPARVKCTANYVVGRLATLEAERSGADAAILMSHEGAIAEGATANVFMVRGGRLATPRICDGILEGITRETLISLWNDGGRPAVEERRIERSELLDCEAAFFCGSLWELTPIASIDGVALDPSHEVIAWLRERYARAVRSRACGRDWVAPC